MLHALHWRTKENATAEIEKYVNYASDSNDVEFLRQCAIVSFVDQKVLCNNRCQFRG